MKDVFYVKAMKSWMGLFEEGDVFVCKRVYFRNGEYQVIIVQNGVVKEYPDVFFVNCDEGGNDVET